MCWLALSPNARGGVGDGILAHSYTSSTADQGIVSSFRWSTIS